MKNNRARLLAAAGLVASMLPIGATTAPAQAAAVPFGGFTAESWSTPIRVEVYEPSIPIPATPQAEFELGYSKVKADSGSSSGRASYAWPGGPVGEGLRTFGEALGLPADNPLTGSGYPIQVNSQYPGEPATQKDEPFPGMVMRTTSGDKTAVAETGFSPDGAVRGPEAGDAPKDGDTEGNPLSQLQEQLGNASGSGVPGGAKTKQTADEPSTPGLPPELAALVDMDGYVSVSRIRADDGPVASASRASLGEVRLLGGLVTLGGVEAIARTTTDGAKGTATGKSVYGQLELGGQKFSIGPDGAVAAGKPAPIPGLNDDPAKALDQLGISFEVAKPTRKVEGDAATSLSEGLRVIIDTSVLAPALSAIPAAQLAQLVPAEAGPLKGLVAGLSTLAPRVVLTLGIASATADTVPPIAPVAPPAGGGGTETGTPPAAPDGGSGSGDGAATAGTPAAAGSAPAGGAPAPSEDVGALVDAAPASAGLPDLFSIPGMLMMGAFIAAAVAGSWFRRIGAAALGAGSSCPHGLDSGLPDLRKA